MATWTTKKPKFNRECTFLTANKVSGKWEYALWHIKKIEVDDKWYWGWLNSYGEEYADLKDLKAQRYMIITEASDQPADFTSQFILDEMDSDMGESGVSQGEIVSCLNHWRNKYLIIPRKESKSFEEKLRFRREKK